MDLAGTSLQSPIGSLLKYMRFDDGIKKTPKGPIYDYQKDCFGTHTCIMGVANVLKAFAEIRESERTEEIKKMIDDAAEFILKHHIYKKSSDPETIIKRSWLQFSFPVNYQSDILDILDILTKLGYKDKRMEHGINVVLSNREKSGIWVNTNP